MEIEKIYPFDSDEVPKSFLEVQILDKEQDFKKKQAENLEEAHRIATSFKKEHEKKARKQKDKHYIDNDNQKEKKDNDELKQRKSTHLFGL